jgi:hypothetical protein
MFHQLRNRLDCLSMKLLVRAFTISIVLACAGWSQDQHKPLVLFVEQTKDSPAYHLDNADVSADPLRGLGLAVAAKGKLAANHSS